MRCQQIARQTVEVDTGEGRYQMSLGVMDEGDECLDSIDKMEREMHKSPHPVAAKLSL